MGIETSTDEAIQRLTASIVRYTGLPLDRCAALLRDVLLWYAPDLDSTVNVRRDSLLGEKVWSDVPGGIHREIYIWPSQMIDEAVEATLRDIVASLMPGWRLKVYLRPNAGRMQRIASVQAHPSARERLLAYGALQAWNAHGRGWQARAVLELECSA